VASTGIFGEQKVNRRCLTMNVTRPERLELRWLPVVDASGRTRMEATWVAVPSAAVPREHAVTHAA
jgi:hypothetical protein